MQRLLGVAMGAVLSLPLGAQSAPAKGPEYEVVSVKPTKEQSGSMMIKPTADGYSATGANALFMIMDAYQLRNFDLVMGLPAWAKTMRFDVETKMSPEMIEESKKLTQDERDRQRRLMVRAMLVDRFKLVAREESKEMPVYALVPSKGGFRLKPLVSSEPEKTGAKLPNGMRGGMLMNGHNSLTGQSISIQFLASALSNTVHRQVVDRTGITGDYDFTLKFQPEDAPAGGDSSDPSIFTALEEQMGLKLEPTRDKVPSVIVEHIEQPGAND